MVTLQEYHPIDTVQDIVESIESVDQEVKELIIDNQTDYLLANEYLKKIKQDIRSLDEQRKKATQPLDRSKKMIMSWFKFPIERGNYIVSRINVMMIGYQSKKEKERKEHEEKLRKQADKEEQKKREVLQRKAEKERARGNDAKAEELEMEKETTFIPRPIVQTELPKTDGTTTVKYWKFRVTDETKIPRRYLMVNEKLIGSDVRNHKGNIDIEGIEVYCEEQIKTTGR